MPKVDPAKASKPAAATAAAGNVSVQGKKEEAKQSQTKVDKSETSQGGGCLIFLSSLPSLMSINGYNICLEIFKVLNVPSLCWCD